MCLMVPMRLRMPQYHLSIYKGRPPNSRSVRPVTIYLVPVPRQRVYAPHRGSADCLKTAMLLTPVHPSHPLSSLLWGPLTPLHLQLISQKPQYLIPSLIQTLIQQFSATVHQRPNSRPLRTKKSKRRTALSRRFLPEHHRHLLWTR